MGMELTGHFKRDFENWLNETYSEHYIQTYRKAQEKSWIVLFIIEVGLNHKDIEDSVKKYNEYYDNI